MAQKEILNSCLQEMMQVLKTSKVNQTELLSEEGSDTKAVNADANKELIRLVQKMQKTVDTLPSTHTQQQSKGFLGGFSFPSLGGSSKKVQMYMPIPTVISKEFAEAVIKLCKDYKCEISNGVETLQRDLPLIVVCPISSRFEPDIDHALTGLKWSSAFVALVLHSCTESTLPSLPTASRLSDKAKYQHTEFIDIAFSAESKLYPCQMNTNAKEKLNSFLSRFYKK